MKQNTCGTNQAGNVEYHVGTTPKVVKGCRPLWPCRETISSVAYDYQTAKHICDAWDGHIFRTPDGHYFIAGNGLNVRRCSKIAVIEALIAYHISSLDWADFREFMPALQPGHMS